MATAKEKQDRGIRKAKIGVVMSDRMDKTVVVRVERVVLDPVYKKYTKRRTTYKAHDERNEYHVGDTVEIIETRPLSKEKCWRVSRLIVRPEVR
ncbi:MAG TPA: 30S ribosomal protein S17 [Candidatus Deferrimicrobiaceae bacterium]|jgi:small subunit ribosomal protein S17|nr:30S ribosomal protein S17 [Candidatus Deferrimicrobiaceae bacterium]